MAIPGEAFGVLVPIVALSIPLVKILSRHQTQMAQIIHGQSQQNASANETSELKEEVRQLRELMHQQTIALDNLRDEVKSSHNLQVRVTEKS